jgi:hypothetical protein
MCADMRMHTHTHQYSLACKERRLASLKIKARKVHIQERLGKTWTLESETLLPFIVLLLIELLVNYRVLTRHQDLLNALYT